MFQILNFKNKLIKKIDIALIQLPLYSLEEPPFGISSLKSYLTKNEITIKCFDLNLSLILDKIIDIKYWYPPLYNYWWSETKFNIIKKKITPYIEIFLKEIIGKYKSVGLSIGSFASYSTAILVAKIIKKFDKNIIIIAGGMGCFKIYNPDPIINCKEIDIIISGEGEKSLKEVLFWLKKGKKIHKLNIPGTYILKGDNKIYYPGYNLISNLDEIPPSDYSDFDLKKYGFSALPIESSRGCINKCTFCNEHLLFGYYRTKSARVIFEEIMFQIKNNNIRSFSFKDSLLNGDLENLEKFCDLLIQSREKIFWSGQILIREMSSNLIKKMKLAGFYSLSIGLESGSQKVIDKMKKGFKISTASSLIKRIHDNGIKVCINIIVGFPGETKEDFFETINFISKSKKYIDIISEIDWCNLDDGSRLKENKEEYNIIDTESGKWRLKDNSNNFKIRYIRYLIMLWYIKKMKFKINQSLEMQRHLLLVNKHFLILNKFSKSRDISLSKIKSLINMCMNSNKIMNIKT